MLLLLTLLPYALSHFPAPRMTLFNSDLQIDNSLQPIIFFAKTSNQNKYMRSWQKNKATVANTPIPTGFPLSELTTAVPS